MSVERLLIAAAVRSEVTTVVGGHFWPLKNAF